MAERIDELIYAAPTNPTTKEILETDLFLTGPAEFLCLELANQLKADPVWSALFGDFIDGYKRMDYAMRNLPAMRIYNDNYQKTAESWFITGMIKIDLVFPASIRRRETQQIPDSVSAALLQQFRRPSFFASIGEKVPGLNELGKTFDVDKSLAFEWSEDQLVPLIQTLVNFKMDLRQWDDYLESDYRTKDDPFSRPLGDLTSIVTIIQALRDDAEVDFELVSEQPISQEPEV